MKRMRAELVAWFKVLESSTLYATIIVTFVMQVVAGEHQSYDDWGPEVIPDGYCFVLGDNRSNSSDSRTFGFVPKEYIIAKVQLRWWPPSAATLF